MKRYGWLCLAVITTCLLFVCSISSGAISSENLTSIEELKADILKERQDNEKRRKSVLKDAQKLASILSANSITEFKDSSFNILNKAKEIIDQSEKLITNIPNNISQDDLVEKLHLARFGLIAVMEADILVMKKEKNMINKGIVVLEAVEKLKKMNEE